MAHCKANGKLGEPETKTALKTFKECWVGTEFQKMAMFELDGQCKNLQVIPTIEEEVQIPTIEEEVQIAVKEYLSDTVTTDGGLIAQCEAKGRLTNPSNRDAKKYFKELFGKEYKKKAMFELDGQCKDLEAIPSEEETDAAAKEYLDSDAKLIGQC